MSTHNCVVMGLDEFLKDFFGKVSNENSYSPESLLVQITEYAIESAGSIFSITLLDDETKDKQSVEFGFISVTEESNGDLFIKYLDWQ